MACGLLFGILAAPAGADQRAYFADFLGSRIPFHPLAGNGAPLPSGLVPPKAGAAGLEAVAISPDGKRLLTGGRDGEVYNFSVNPASGALSPGPGPASLVTDSVPYGLVVTPNGKYAYQATVGGTIVGLAIAANGAISKSIPGLPKAVSGGAVGLAVSGDGKYLYVTEGDGEVGSYAIGGNGSLSELSGSPLAGIESPVPISLSPDGKYAFVPSRDATPDLFSLFILPDGSLAFLFGGHVSLPAGGNPFGSVVTPDGRRYYVANFDDSSLSGFRINSDGTLTELAGSPYAVSAEPAAVTSDADGSHLYVSNDISGAVDVLALDPNGIPTPIAGSPFAVDTGATGDFQSVALSPDQPPTARLRVSAQTPQRAILDASASSDPDGDGIATYHWDFGDGESATSDTPVVSHSYAPEEIYFPGVSIVDERGCGVSYVSSGQTAFCNGGSQARIGTEVITIKPKLRAHAAKKQKLGRSLKLGVSVPNVPVSVEVSATATLKGSRLKKLVYKPASTDLQPGGVDLRLKLKRRAKRAAKHAKRGRASIKVTGTGNGYTLEKKLRVKLRH